MRPKFVKDNTIPSLDSFDDAIAGFYLCAWKLDDGSYQLGSFKGRGQIIKEFPGEIEFGNNVYTLEDVEVYGDNFVNAIYV